MPIFGYKGVITFFNEEEPNVQRKIDPGHGSPLKNGAQKRLKDVFFRSPQNFYPLAKEPVC